MEIRTIIFRGKRTDNGEWVYGFYDKANYKCYINYEEITEKYGKELKLMRSNEVVPETIGQYTGLKDKNGKRIFEGDVVAGALSWLEKPKNGIVKFQNGSFGLLWYRGEAEQFNPFTSMCNIEYEVIGNIHDNPEL